MQVSTPHTAKKKRIAMVLICILLALVLGLGGYFGTLALITGRNPLDRIGSGPVPKSDLPTDSDGNNLTGNSMQNLYAGGLMAMQGEDVFYVNPADGGSLYCRDRKGRITKLTDFAVANLNVRDEQLIFTDLDACSILRANGDTAMVSASTHKELWAKAAQEDHIRYGGHLYFILGIKSFCAGELSYEDLTIVALESEQRYQAPILTEDAGLILIEVSPMSDAPSALRSRNAAPAVRLLSTSGSGGTAPPTNPQDIDYFSYSATRIDAQGVKTVVELHTVDMPQIKQNATAGGKGFMETFDTVTRESSILMYDLVTGEVVATIPGHAMQSDGDNLYFVNDATIFKYEPEMRHLTQVTQTPCDASYTLRPDGAVAYSSYTGAGVIVPMVASLDEEGNYAPKMDRSVLSARPLDKFMWFGKRAYELDRTREFWTRIEDQFLMTDPYDYVNLKTLVDLRWSRERRDKGPNAVKWLPDSSLSAVLRDYSKADPTEDVIFSPTATPMPRPEPERNYTVDDMAHSLAAVTRMAQGYGYYEHGQIDLGFSPDQYDMATQYYVDAHGNDFSLDSYIDPTVAGLLSELGLDASYEADVRKAIKFWITRFEFAVGTCTIDTSDEGAGEEGRGMVLVLERVHLTSDNFSKALAAAVAARSTEGEGAVERGEAYAMQWIQGLAMEILHNPFGNGLVDKTDTTLAIYMLHDAELGWMPEYLDSIRSSFIRMDSYLNINLADFLPDPTKKPNAGGGLEGSWRRGGEVIYFEDDQITWTMGGRDGKVIIAGTFEVRKGSLYVNAGAQGSTSFNFSQSGDKMTIENWSYERE